MEEMPKSGDKVVLSPGQTSSTSLWFSLVASNSEFVSLSSLLRDSLLFFFSCRSLFPLFAFLSSLGSLGLS